MAFGPVRTQVPCQLRLPEQTEKEDVHLNYIITTSFSDKEESTSQQALVRASPVWRLSKKPRQGWKPPINLPLLDETDALP